MIRKTLLAAATAVILGAGFTGVGGIAVPTSAQAQWRDYDRPYYGQRRYYRERDYYRDRRYDRGYRAQRPAYGGRQVYQPPTPVQGYRGGSGGAGQGYSGVLPNGRPYYTPPGQQLPPGQSYTTPPGRNDNGGGYN
jgi:hypothetical protein